MIVVVLIIIWDKIIVRIYRRIEKNLLYKYIFVYVLGCYVVYVKFNEY